MAWRGEPGDVALLPGGFDGARRVMLPDEGNGLVRWHAINDGQAGQGCTGSAPAAHAGDFHAVGQRVLPGFVQDFASLRPSGGQPEIGPPQPPDLPGGGWWR